MIQTIPYCLGPFFRPDRRKQVQSTGLCPAPPSVKCRLQRLGWASTAPNPSLRHRLENLAKRHCPKRQGTYQPNQFLLLCSEASSAFCKTLFLSSRIPSKNQSIYNIFCHDDCPRHPEDAGRRPLHHQPVQRYVLNPASNSATQPNPNPGNPN